ncbi:MAG: P-loop NTPase [Actinobacteria bacterium]|nr:P-loop NTPase [Actinomycetota bacterium]
MTAVKEETAFGVAVVEADPERRQGLACQLGEVGIAVFPSLHGLQSELVGSASAVVVLGPSCALRSELEQVEWLARSRPALGVVLVVEELSTTVLQQAMRAGVKDVLASPDRAQLAWAVARVADSLTLATASQLVLAPPSNEALGRVVSVFSAKGGSGTSVVAANLAVTLARRLPGTVALVDADLQFGDVAVMLESRLEHSIADAAAAGERLDAPLLQSLMVRHDPSGLLVLPAPIEPALAEKVGAEDVRRIIEVLRSFCDHIVVDTASRFDDVTLALFDQSDEIVMVSGMEVPGIKNLKLGVQTLRLLDTPASKLKLVLVRSNTKVQMELRDIERALALKADVVVPNDAVVPESLNKCVPVVIDAPRSAVSRAFEALADAFVPAAEPVKRRRAIFSWRG